MKKQNNAICWLLWWLVIVICPHSFHHKATGQWEYFAVFFSSSLFFFICYWHWFENYLAERKQAVVLHGSRSDYLTVPAGVPQDSVLEPFLFLIYIDDILEDIESVINFSADDTIMYLGWQNLHIRAAILNNELDKIMQWPNKWKI